MLATMHAPNPRALKFLHRLNRLLCATHLNILAKSFILAIFRELIPHPINAITPTSELAVYSNQLFPDFNNAIYCSFIRQTS